MSAHPAAPAFVADVMLGRLARTLRMLGYDTSYRSDATDDDIKLAAVREGRVVLTRDRQIAETRLPIRVVLVRDDRVADQIRQVVRELGLAPDGGLFTRCVVCNSLVADVPREEVRDRVPPYVFATQNRFARCPGCGRTYWSATHVERARRWLREALGGDTAAHEGGGAAPARPGALPRKNVLLTGRPGVGKTTLLNAVLRSLRIDARGFVTREILERGRRVGFSITDLRGPTGVLARVDLESPHRVGRYGVNRGDIERIGIPALDDATAHARLIVMDEIGRMELCSPAFQSAVLRALDSPAWVLGTIQDRSNRFLDSIRARDDVELVRITVENRESARGRVLSLLTRLSESGGGGAGE